VAIPSSQTPVSPPLRRLEFISQLEDDVVSEPRAGRRLVSVVVPLLNEQPTIGDLYDELAAALAEQDLRWEVVFVDDGSTDGSYQELVRLHEAHLNVRVVRLRRNFGKAAALAAGVEVASGRLSSRWTPTSRTTPARFRTSSQNSTRS
jgi:cellulose synthase/poly-beta-1,6-N-acetylglucosamine synthase-like glycosyltransferase